MITIAKEEIGVWTGIMIELYDTELQHATEMSLWDKYEEKPKPHLLDNASHKGLLKTEQAQNQSIMQSGMVPLPQQQPVPLPQQPVPVPAESKNHSVK